MEDSSKNCMDDSMEVFEEICNNQIFNKSHIILFFNKTDLFRAKIKNVPITECPAFKDFEIEHKKYDDPDYYYNECCSFIAAKFNALNHTEKTIYAHFTCAMQKDNILNVFEDVKNIILMKETKKMVPSSNYH